MKSPTLKEQITQAARLRSNLTVFGAVQGALESGAITSESFEAQERISTICRSEMQRLVKKYDRLVARIEGGR